MEWTTVTLNEIGFLGRGKSKHRPRYDEKLYHGKYPFIQTGDIKASNGKITKYSQTYNDFGLAQSKLWPTNTMVITIAANIAETAILSFPACFPDSVVGFIADETKANVRYVEFVFRCLRKEIQRKATGSVQDNINLETLSQIKFKLPPLSLQNKIASTLGCLDDKIEINNQMNEALEAMVKAIFKEWFIDFGPVKAKAEAKKPFGMDDETAALFPNSFEESEIGMVPKGWVTQPLVQIIDLIGGGTPKTSIESYWNGSIPWFSVVDTPPGSNIWLIDTEKKISQEGLNNSSTKLLPVGTTIISARGTVGNLALVGVPTTMNQSCYGIRSKGQGDYFIYLTVSNMVQQLRQNSHGSVFDTITRDTFNGITVAIPTADSLLFRKFENLVSVFFEKIRSNVLESSSLGKARDLLLPKIISGDLNLSEIAND